MTVAKTKTDNVKHPAHYTRGKIEVWDFIVDQRLDYLLGCVVKYVTRAGYKDPGKELEDLKKARAYLDKRISALETSTRASAEHPLNILLDARHESLVINKPSRIASQPLKKL